MGADEPLTELNSFAREAAPSITADGQHLYFLSDRSGSRQLYVATRDEAGGFFVDPRRVELNVPGGISPRGPEISSDGLELYFHGRGNNTPTNLWLHGVTTLRIPLRTFAGSRNSVAAAKRFNRASHATAGRSSGLTIPVASSGLRVVQRCATTISSPSRSLTRGHWMSPAAEALRASRRPGRKQERSSTSCRTARSASPRGRFQLRLSAVTAPATATSTSPTRCASSKGCSPAGRARAARPRPT